VSGTIAITGSASDSVGVTHIEFFAASNLIAKSAGPNYTVSWNTAAVPNGPVTLTARAFDAALNASASATIQVTVGNAPDTTPPVITVPPNASVEATGATGAVFTYTASAVDAVDGNVAVACTPGCGSTFPLGATTVACTASDTHGNTRTASFSVIVVDTLAPSVTPPAAITVAATEINGARGNVPASAVSQRVGAFLAGGTAVDLRDAAPVRLVPQASVNATVIDATANTLLPVGTTNVVFRSRDASGNIGSAASAITVLPPVGGVVDTPNTPIVPTNADNAPQAITVSFATVTQPGLLTADAMAAPAPPPAGFLFAGAGVVDIVTTALVAPPIEVCLQGVGFTAQDRALHYEAGAWLDVTTASTPTNVCATVA